MAQAEAQTTCLIASMHLAYLKALGIDVWLPRGRADAGLSAAQPAARAAVQDPGAVHRKQADAQPATVQAAAAVRAPVRTPVGSPVRAPLTVSAAGSWAELEASVRACTLCTLHTTRTQAVFGVGDRSAQWMVIGEAPGMDEDRQGEPFVGRAGQLLTAMLNSLGMAREQVFIANILKSRPPDNRDPKPEEIQACLPYLYRQIELVNPKLILCVGRIAAQTLLQTSEPIGKLRGAVHRIMADRPVVVTYHPAYLLRSPGEKRRAWADLVLAMRTYRAAAGEAVA